MSNESPAAILYDNAGNPIEVVNFGGKYYVANSMLQNVVASTVNSSTTNLAAGASFTGGSDSTFGIAGFQVNVKSDQPLRVSVQQSNDGTNWDIQDVYEANAGVGYGRTVQATSEYIRVVVTNLGPVTTTYFRLKCVLCPTVEALPRMLTPRGRLALSSSMSGFLPDPTSFLTFREGRALLLDSERNLMTRGPVLTDELSFRDDFTASSLQTALTGACYFRNGEKHVVGVGTQFLTEVKKGQYIKLSTDADDKLAVVSDVYSDTDLVLEEGYTGTTDDGTGNIASWISLFGTGASYSMTGSELIFTSGTTIYSPSMVMAVADYLPFIIRTRVKFSQRIANQSAMVGFMDNDVPPNADAQAYILFDGTDNTKVEFVTASDSTSIERTTVTLPAGGTTATYKDYQIQVSNDGVSLWVDGVLLVRHTTHIPGPYQLMNVYVGIYNYGTPASSSDFTLDYVSFSNFDSLDVDLTPAEEPLRVVDAVAVNSVSANVAAAVATTTVLALNTARLGMTVFNDTSTGILYLKLGSGATATSFTVRMMPQDYYELPFRYTGIITGYWSVADGNARVTELT
jgi:hypothetical protein